MRLYKFYVHGIISLLLGLSRMFFETAFFMPFFKLQTIGHKLLYMKRGKILFFNVPRCDEKGEVCFYFF
jgi:hypothetical protein